MRPRTAPLEFGVADTALAAADRYGKMSRYRQAVDHALSVVFEYSQHGLPAELEFADWITVESGASRGNWWLYIDEVQDIYLGFVESARAESLRLVGLAPKRELSRDAFLQTCKEAT